MSMQNVRFESCYTNFVAKDSSYLRDLQEYDFNIKKQNNRLRFISPDTISSHRILKYYLREGDFFSLQGDSMIMTYDPDSFQVTQIQFLPDVTNGFYYNSTLMYHSQPGVYVSTGVISSYIPCGKATPFRITVLAFNDGTSPDSVSFTIELYVLPHEISKPEICGVSVDPYFKKNVVNWINNDERAYSYIVYKENKLTGIYDSIGYVSSNKLNSFYDEGSDPVTMFDSYKIVTVDRCGARSIASESINSILLETQRMSERVVNLTWTAFQGGPKDSFIVWRANTHPQFKKIKTLPITQTSFNDSADFVWEVKHRIELKRDSNCITFDGNPIQSFSNIVSDLFGGVSNTRISDFSIIPNPASSEVSITILNHNEELDLIIFDVHGKKILQQKFQKKSTIDLQELQSGVYFIRIGDTVRRFVKL